MSRPRTVERPLVDGLPWTVPGGSLHTAFAAVAVALALSVAPPGPWTLVSLGLTAVTVAVPRWRTAWVLIAVLAFSVLVEPTGGPSLRVALLIAGAHALHLLGAWMLVVPARARLQPAVLLPGLRRFVLIQLPIQATSVVLAVIQPPSGDSVAAVVAGLAVLAVVTLLAGMLLRRTRR